MALDEPTEEDNRFAQDGYTIIVEPRVTEIAGPITVEKHRWGGLLFTTSNDRP